MELVMNTDEVQLYRGDCREVMASLPDNSVDSIVTDPPYELGFMGKGWDSSGIAFDPEVWAQALRVLKPGGHLLAFGGTRTWHRVAVAVEDAGFEIRDSIAWLYGSGFPKSMDVSKAIDKQGGNSDLALEIAAAIKEARTSRGISITSADAIFCGSTTMYSWFEGRPGGVRIPNDAQFTALASTWPELAKYADAVRTVPRDKTGMHRSGLGMGSSGVGGAGDGKAREDVAATDSARQWQGWGTALKPAFEPVVVARKPFQGTVAANVLAYGTGAINVDACRIGTEGGSSIPGGMNSLNAGNASHGYRASAYQTDTPEPPAPSGRWPANVLLDQHAAAWVDEQSGARKSGSRKAGVYRGIGYMGSDATEYPEVEASEGGASRFFYTAKAPKSERPNVDGVQHATVKPLAIMRWLIRLVTPPGGTVLEPFAGSGTTLEAAALEGFKSIGIELDGDGKHIPLILKRLSKPLTPAMF